MSNRYIRRYCLSARQYTPGCPVVLAAGALLEDTKLPRLVAQIKFKSISDAVITGLSLTVRCLDGDGAERNAVGFQYQNLTVSRGQAFGQYTAIVLPAGDTRRLRVKVTSVRFENGTSWSMNAGAVWGVLPAFTPLESTLHDPELLVLSRTMLPRNQYVYAAPSDLWYCSCGGVNHSGEIQCHRCQQKHSDVAQYADPNQLALLLQARREEFARIAAEQAKARQEEKARREAERQALRLEAEAKAADLKAAAEEKTALLKQQAGETAEQLKSRFDNTVSNVKSGKKKLIALGAGLLAVIALVLLVPKFADNLGFSGDPKSTGSEEEPLDNSVAAGSDSSGQSRANGDSDDSAPGPGLKSFFGEEPLRITTSTDGEIITFDITEDAAGECRVTVELVREQFPEAACMNFFGVPGEYPLGSGIDSYLIDSFQMASLVASRGERGSGNEWAALTPKEESKSTWCMLIFDRSTHLIGHYVGVLEDVGGGVWRMPITRCDYDFTQLYEEQLALFNAGKEVLYQNYIAPEDVADSGAKYFLTGYQTGRSPDPREDDTQMYHLWSELNSPNLELFCRSMEQFDRRTVREGRWECFLLFDKDYQLIGYTMRGK